MPSKYKLTYFDIRGRAELTRMVFALADVQYEDVRVTREQMQQMKPSLPFGQVPILEIDGQVYCQSNTIARYLAEEFGFGGKTTLEKLKADMVVDCLYDFTLPLTAIFRAADQKEKEELKKKFADEQAPQMLANLEKMVGPSGFVVGSNITYADLAVLVYLEWPISKMHALPLDYSKYPKLKGVIDKTSANPKIAAWLKKRPDNSI